MLFKIIRLIFLILLTTNCPLRSFDLLNRPIIIINSTSNSTSNYGNETKQIEPYKPNYNYDFEPSRVEDFGYNLEY